MPSIQQALERNIVVKVKEKKEKSIIIV